MSQRRPLPNTQLFGNGSSQQLARPDLCTLVVHSCQEFIILPSQWNFSPLLQIFRHVTN